MRSVGEQDYAFRFCLSVLDSVDGCGKAVADGGIVFEYAHLHFVEIVDQLRVVSGHRNRRKCFTGKNNKADIVVRASGYEV